MSLSVPGGIRMSSDQTDGACLPHLLTPSAAAFWPEWPDNWEEELPTPAKVFFQYHYHHLPSHDVVHVVLSVWPKALTWQKKKKTCK